MSTLTVSNIKKTGETASRDVSGVAAAWVNFNGTGTIVIRDSMGVGSITDEGVGLTKASFTSAMSNDEFAMTATASNDGGTTAVMVYAPNVSIKSTTSTGTLHTRRISNSSGIDDPHVSSTIHGDLA